MTSGKFWPVSMCIDRKRQLLGREGLNREVQEHRGVLTAGEEQDRAFALATTSRGMKCVGLQQVEVVGWSWRCARVSVVMVR